MLLAQAPTGRIIGTVLDDEGNPLPGVAVEATSPKLIGISSVMTDESGVYRIFALPPGIYEIKYTLQAFNTVIRKDIIVKLEQTITVDITMTPGVVEEQITVLGRSPLIDVKSTYKGMILSREMFQMLPKGRNFDTLVTAVPGVSNEPWLGGISVEPFQEFPMNPGLAGYQWTELPVLKTCTISTVQILPIWSWEQEVKALLLNLLKRFKSKPAATRQSMVAP
jgi:hypothetical protein